MISIIVPTFNEQGALQHTLENLKTMTTTSYEIIVSDGRSVDATQEIATRYTDKIAIYQGTTRQTIANARNLGTTLARGEYLVFIDADTHIPAPDAFFHTLIQAFESDASLAGVTVSIKVAPDQAYWQDKPFFGFVNLVHRLMNNVFHTGSCSGEFQMVRRSFFDRIKGYNDLLVTYEDNNLFERLAKIGKTRMIHELTIFHSGRRVHKVGHLKLLGIWAINVIWVKLFQKALTQEWQPIR